VDAEHAFLNATPATIADSNATVDVGLTVDEATIDLSKTPKWGPYNPAHTYEQPIVDQERPASLLMQDLGSRSLEVRLLPAGRIERATGGAYPAPATWHIRRCRPHGGITQCLLKATLCRQTWFATVPEASLMTVELADAGVVVHLERFSKPV
jgi:hypothetical protein